MSRSRPRATPLRTLLVLLFTLLALLPAGTAAARGGSDDGGGGGGSTVSGNFAVTVNGRTYDPAAGRDASLRDVTPAGRIAVRGVHVAFTLDPTTLGVHDYTLTGAADPQRMVTAPTVVFTSKVPVLTAAQLRGVRLTSMRLRDDYVELQLSTAAGTFKVQAKDFAQGGIFQMEQEFAGPVEYVHTLGDGVFYFVNEFTGKVNFGNGVPADATHQMLLGKDSPQVATKLSQTATTTRWSVAPGGRMGGVLGEDAIELSAGATNCTTDCQARNRIQDSVPVPPGPTAPTPLG